MGMRKEDFENEDIELELNQLNETVNEGERKKRVKEEFVVFLFLTCNSKRHFPFKEEPLLLTTQQPSRLSRD